MYMPFEGKSRDCSLASARRALTALLFVGALLSTPLSAQTSTSATARRHHRHKRTTHAVAHATTQAAVIHTSANTGTKVAIARRRTRGHRVVWSPWTEPTYADSTVGDNVDGEDLVVRRAALDALGPYNGTVVVSNPDNGRILSIVNQKLALKGAFQPCSTVKIMVSLASLKEGITAPETRVRLTRRFSLDMTHALAMSNNMYFAHMGEELGFEKVVNYGKLFGLGEKAGLDIAGEEPGFLASEVPASGVGMMTSFGDGIRVTPLELASIVGAVANGGTMYYLQYPRTQDDVQKFVPRIKRVLNIDGLTTAIKPGMMGAVEYGTARRAKFDMTSPIYGKTGTCTDTAQPGVHLGWFGSFNEAQHNRVSVVVLLTGGRGTSGPIASGIAGEVYRNLANAHYFDAPAAQPAQDQKAQAMPASLVSFANLLLP